MTADARPPGEGPCRCSGTTTTSPARAVPAAAPGGPGATSAVAGFAAAQGWPPAGDRPFDGHLEDAVAEINRTMHGAARALGRVRLHGIRVGATTFGDAYRGSIDGRAVIVANAWTSIGPEVRGARGRCTEQRSAPWNCRRYSRSCTSSRATSRR